LLLKPRHFDTTRQEPSAAHLLRWISWVEWKYWKGEAHPSRFWRPSENRCATWAYWV